MILSNRKYCDYLLLFSFENEFDVIIFNSIVDAGIVLLSNKIEDKKDHK
jgi:hypothetical protein